MNQRSNRIVTTAVAALAALAVAGAGYKYATRFRPPASPARAEWFDTLALSNRGVEPALPAASQPEADALEALAGGLTDPTGRKTVEPWANIRAADGDPGGVAPPPGARRVSSFSQKESLQELARYLVNSSPDVLESYYADSLTAAGWRRVGRRSDGGLLYGRGNQTCLVRFAPGGGETAVVVVVTTLPK